MREQHEECLEMFDGTVFIVGDCIIIASNENAGKLYYSSWIVSFSIGRSSICVGMKECMPYMWLEWRII